MSNDKLQYLQAIQQTIGRMSTNSAIFKGFAAAVTSGIIMPSYEGMNIWLLVLSFTPTIAFFALDVYYLSLERRFRYLYEQIRTDQHDVDFSMRLPNEPLDLLVAKARLWDCIKSPSIWMFYPLLMVVMAAVFCLKCWGAI